MPTGNRSISNCLCLETATARGGDGSTRALIRRTTSSIGMPRRQRRADRIAPRRVRLLCCTPSHRTGLREVDCESRKELSMERMLVVVFDDEIKAYEASRALQGL